MDYRISVKRPGTVKVSTEWKNDADLNLYLYDSRGKQLA
ncbi:pre-peptidase C-terminal domain-containing protein [Salmonella enterica]